MVAFSSFLLEDRFNELENKYDTCLSSGVLEPYSLEEIIRLCADDDSNSYKNIRAGVIDKLLNLKLDYPEQYGSKRLREELVKIYSPSQNTTVNTDSFLVTCGASEAIFLVFSSLFQRGDTIIVQQPIYQSLYQIAIDQGVNVICWDYDCMSSFESNLLGLKEIFNKADSKKSLKALVLNNPNNPMGIAFNQEEQKQILELTENYSVNNSCNDFYVIVDEVFKDLVDVPSFMCNPLPQGSKGIFTTIVISDLSKSYACPGLRLGWIACKNPELISKFSSQKNYLSLRSPIISEDLAPYILQNREKILNQKRKTIQTNLEYLLTIDPEKLPFELPWHIQELKSKAITGMCLFPRVKQNAEYIVSKDFNNKLIKDKKIFLITGELFASKYKNHLRIGMGLSSEKFSISLSALLDNNSLIK